MSFLFFLTMRKVTQKAMIAIIATSFLYNTLCFFYIGKRERKSLAIMATMATFNIQSAIIAIIAILFSTL